MEITQTPSHLVIILDTSGSMASLRPAMTKALNGLIAEQKTVEAPCKVSFVRFNERVDTVFHEKPLAEVGELDFQPSGTTALFDAVGSTLDSFDAPEDAMVTFVIITDGQENSSQRYTSTKVRDLVGKGEDRQWNFVFLGAGLDAFGQARQVGSQTLNAVSFERGAVTVEAAMEGLSGQLRATRSTGARSVAYTQEVYASVLASKTTKDEGDGTV